MSFSIYTIYGIIQKFWRRKRFKLFVSAIAPAATDRLLDIGGYPANWTQHPPMVGSITTVNVDRVEWNPASAPAHKITSMHADGCKLPFPDKSFSIVFSNSVIEHVGDWSRIQQFAREARRIGGKLWVQTPAYECPIEPHFVAPFIHWLPKHRQKSIARWFTTWGLMTKPTPQQVSEYVDGIRPLKFDEMKQLFPDCTIHTERLFFLFPKSYVAIRK